MKNPLSRRSLLRLAGLGSLGAGLAATLPGRRMDAETPPVPMNHGGRHPSGGHAMGVVGRVSTAEFDPGRFLRSWNFSHLPEPERSRFYRETPRPDGSLLREYEIYAVDREIEIAPGLFFPAWTYNGQVPGPTIRATEGDRIRVNFLNQGSHPHSIHFHGMAPAGDGRLAARARRSRRAGASSTSSTPSRSGCTSTTATPRR